MLEVIPPSSAPALPRNTIKRKLAYLLAKAGRGELYVEAMEKKMRYDNYFAIMIWDLATTGEAYFADGTQLKITEVKEWLDLVKFMAVHMDGPAVLEQNVANQINVYKIYTNIDESKL
jgi:hypothetical protein